MRDRPDALALMEQARRHLLGELLDQLPEAYRYDARLVANAIAIAAREITTGDHDLRAEHKALATLFGEPARSSGPARDSESLDESLERLNWRLAAEIRGGQLDGDERIHILLQEFAIARVRLSNPKALAESG